MVGRKSSRSKKPVSYSEFDVQDSEMQPNGANNSEDEADHPVQNATESDDPDFIAEVNIDSETDQTEAEKENLPAKKRKKLTDYMGASSKNQAGVESDPSPIGMNLVNSDQGGAASQASRLDLLQRTMNERGRDSLNNPCDRSDESFTGILSGINNVRARGTPLRSPSTGLSGGKAKGNVLLFTTLKN